MNFNEVKQFIENLNKENLELLKKIIEKQIEIIEKQIKIIELKKN